MRAVTETRVHDCRPAADADPRWDSRLFIPYSEVDPVDSNGYPLAWERCGHDTGETCNACYGTGSIKNLIRELTGHRCIRCHHPYIVGQQQFWDETVEEDTTEAVAALALFDEEPTDEPRVKRDRPKHWSPCDLLCTHTGLVRSKRTDEDDRYWVREELHDNHEVRDAIASAYEVQAAWRILTVHHLDEHKRNCRWDNLTALCQRCHLNVQRRVKMDRPWPYEHSAWMKPYVAAFYARKYLGEELTRAEAVARMEELLAWEHTQPELA